MEWRGCFSVHVGLNQSFRRIAVTITAHRSAATTVLDLFLEKYSTNYCSAKQPKVANIPHEADN